MHIVAILFLVSAVGAFSSPIGKNQSKFDKRYKECLKRFNVNEEEFKNFSPDDTTSSIFACIEGHSGERDKKFKFAERYEKCLKRFNVTEEELKDRSPDEITTGIFACVEGHS